MNEILSVEFDVKLWKLKKDMDDAWKVWESFSEDFAKRVNTKTAESLANAVAMLKKQVSETTWLLNEAQKRGDFDAEIKYSWQLELLKLQLTQARAEVRNFVKTWDKEVSVLGKLFDNLGSRISGNVVNSLDKLQIELMKTWRSTKEVDHLRNRVNELTEQLNKGKMSASEYAQAINKIEKESEKVAKGLKWGISVELKNLFVKWLYFAGATSISAWIYNIGKSLLLLWDQLEQTSISFEVMLWSASEAKNILTDLSSFASKTPFEIPEIRQNAKQLLAMGISTNELIPTLKALGDVSAWLSVPLDRLSLAYGQVIAKWKLQGGELKQFTEAGVPLIETLSKRIWVSTQEFYKMVEAWQISSWQVVQAFQDMTNEWWKFENLMMRQSSSLSGMWSNLKDQISLLWERMWTALLPFAKGVVSSIWTALQSFSWFMQSSEVQWVIEFFRKLIWFVYEFWWIKIAINAVTTAFSLLLGILKVIYPVIEDIAKSFNAILDTMIQATADFKNYFNSSMQEISGSTADATDYQAKAWEYLSAFIAVAWANLIWFIQGTFDTLIQGIAWVYNYFTSETTWTTDNMKSIFKSSASAIANTILWIVNRTIDLILLPINTAIAWLNKLKELWNSVGWNFQRTDYIRSNLSVWDWKWIFDKAWSAFLSWFEKLANNVNKRVEEKTTSMIDAQVKRVEEQTKSTLEWMKGAVIGWFEQPIASAWASTKKADKVADELAKRQKKREEDLKKARTDAYKKWQESAEKYVKVIEESNKKLDEQKQKLQDIRDKSIETIQDIEEKIAESQMSYSEKLAKRYEDIGNEIRQTVGDDFLAGASNQELIGALINGQIWWERFNELKEELSLLTSSISQEELKLALTQEARSETEKITAEYQKQLDIDKRSLALQEAKVAGRYLTNQSTGQLQFFDENGNIIEWANRDQIKDFASQSKEVQAIADESLRIESEKFAKIADIVKEYEDERRRLNEWYYETDKNMRINQENMSRAYFTAELQRMQTMRSEALATIAALNALKTASVSTNVTNYNTNNSTTNQNIQVKTVADVASVNKSLGTQIKFKSPLL